MADTVAVLAGITCGLPLSVAIFENILKIDTDKLEQEFKGKGIVQVNKGLWIRLNMTNMIIIMNF